MPQHERGHDCEGAGLEIAESPRTGAITENRTWMGLVTVRTFTSSVTSKPECSRKWTTNRSSACTDLGLRDSSLTRKLFDSHRPVAVPLHLVRPFLAAREMTCGRCRHRTQCWHSLMRNSTEPRIGLPARFPIVWHDVEGDPAPGRDSTIRASSARPLPGSALFTMPMTWKTRRRLVAERLTARAIPWRSSLRRWRPRSPSECRVRRCS